MGAVVLITTFKAYAPLFVAEMLHSYILERLVSKAIALETSLSNI